MYENNIPHTGVTDCDSLCDWGIGRGIEIYRRPLGGVSALCVSDGETEAIAIDVGRLPTEAERKCAIAHELGHLNTGALYTACADRNQISRAEYRADMWAVRTLIPRDDLTAAIEQGYTELWQLADRFQVTERMVATAVALYGIEPSVGAAG